MDAASPISERVEEIYRTESRRILATLIRLLGDFDLAEEALQNAFAAAISTWPRDGVPENPRAWLVSAGRFKAVDTLRRRARFNAVESELARSLRTTTAQTEETPELEDDRLRLIFVCCHPSLPPDAQIALTLREVCGLTTEEIARAFLTPRRPSRSESCAPRAKFATPGSPTRFRRSANCTGGWRSCCT